MLRVKKKKNSQEIQLEFSEIQNGAKLAFKMYFIEDKIIQLNNLSNIVHFNIHTF